MQITLMPQVKNTGTNSC